MIFVFGVVVDIEFMIGKNHVARLVKALWGLPQERLANPCIMKFDGDLEAISKFEPLSFLKLSCEVLHLFFVGVAASLL